MMRSCPSDPKKRKLAWVLPTELLPKSLGADFWYDVQSCLDIAGRGLPILG